jgi:hypothetical protein
LCDDVFDEVLKQNTGASVKFSGWNGVKLSKSCIDEADCVKVAQLFISPYLKKFSTAGLLLNPSHAKFGVVDQLFFEELAKNAPNLAYFEENRMFRSENLTWSKHFPQFSLLKNLQTLIIDQFIIEQEDLLEISKLPLLETFGVHFGGYIPTHSKL